MIVKEYIEVTQKLINEWNNLWKNSKESSFFNSYEWFRICKESFKYDYILIITVEKEEKLLLVLPLVKKGNCYISPGEMYLDSTTILVKDTNIELIQVIVDYIDRKRYRVILKEVNESLAKCFINVSKEFASNNPKADLSGGIKNVIKNKELRYLKRIKDKNSKFINFELYKGSDVYIQLNRIFEIEKNSIKPDQKKDIFNREIAKIIFTKISKTNFPLLVILKFKNKDVAHLFSVMSKDSVMAYHMAYDKEYKHIYPGKLNFIYLMEYMIESNLKILDFSRGDSILKRHFSNGNIKKFNIYINNSIYGEIKIILKRILYYIKQTKGYKKVKNRLKKIGRVKLWIKKR